MHICKRQPFLKPVSLLLHLFIETHISFSMNKLLQQQLGVHAHTEKNYDKLSSALCKKLGFTHSGSIIDHAAQTNPSELQNPNTHESSQETLLAPQQYEQQTAHVHVQQLTPQQYERMHEYYMPMYLYLKHLVRTHREKCSCVCSDRQNSSNGGGQCTHGGSEWTDTSVRAHSRARTLVVGISAPQGCGKTTLVEAMEFLFKLDNMRPAVVSIDDFYLTGAEQDALAQKYAHNPLLRYRGNAGTHDIDLGKRTIKALLNIETGDTERACAREYGSETQTVSGMRETLIPVYEKSMRNGRGDRAPIEKWKRQETPIDILLVEGWMLGFPPLSEEQLAGNPHMPHIGEVNSFLSAYSAWHSHMHAWVVVKVPHTEWVYEWRLQQERALRASGKGGMSDEQVRDFVQRFMPAYDTYLPHMYTHGPHMSHNKPILTVCVDAQRTPVDASLTLS
eukprot:GDKI01044782.1.p1 GENE.GDKI01044782.1~~GDKI01044782.1.p1  ORF type:complete len:449 (-),score=79.74 GDKI01044782.1:104-1450(-)